MSIDRIKSQAADTALFEGLDRRLSNSFSSNRLSLGFRVQLCTHRLMPVPARDCELRVSSCMGLGASALGEVPLTGRVASEISGTVN